MRKVEVDLKPRGYSILIDHDLKAAFGQFIRQAGFSNRALLVSDTNVGKLYAETVADLLKQAGLSPDIYIVPAGESSKSLTEAEKLYTRAIEAGLDRHSAVFALGGGVVGDLAGFIAATYMRGIPLVQLPTSLLAQVDSSVGGKVAVNHRLGKNLIGAFYQPQGVFIDLDFLSTLPKREIYTGLGEIIKYGVIYDEAFFTFLENNVEAVLALEPTATAAIIARSCLIKAKIVDLDEKETGLRCILNFGHTIGHAIEKDTHYVRYNHGEAVAIGMIGAAHISRELGMIDDATVQRLIALIWKLHLPTQAEGCNLDAILVTILHDKKTINGKVHWVLMNGIGRVTSTDQVPDAVVRRCIQAVLAV